MKLKIGLFFLATLAFVTACTFSTSGGGGGVIVSRSQTTFGSSGDKSKQTQEKCEDLDDCVNLCYDIYDADEIRGSAPRECIKLTAQTAYRIRDVKDILEDPIDLPLSQISSRDFERF